MSDASERYARALLAARQHGFRLTAASEALVREAFRQAMRDLDALRLSTHPLTAARAAVMRRELVAILARIERQVARITDTSVTRSVADIMAIHQQVTVSLAAAAGLRTAGLAARLDRAAVRAAVILAARRPSASFLTLYRRHVLEAAPALDRLLVAAVAQGMSSRRLAGHIATLLAGDELRGTPLGALDLAGLRSLQYDARRIAVSETNTALRESSALALNETGLVAAVQWQRSGRHHAIPHLSPDECDVLAETDFYGLGPGWYPPSLFPVAPHPFCACTPGATRLRHPSEWLTPAPAAGALRVDPMRMRFPPAWAARWSEDKQRRIRQTIAASLARESQPRQRRRAA